MERRHAAEIQGLKEANLMLRRDLYGVRDDLRDGLRNELGQLVHDVAAERIKDLEAKARVFEVETFGRIKALENEVEKAAAAAAAAAVVASATEIQALGYIKTIEGQVKKHEAYIQASHDAKPEDARIIAYCFKHLEEQVEKTKAALQILHGPALLDR